ncbi:GlxA family transcriptional regulator [Hahella sp. NBU794]|uniref:GlxA family transcriptional regulator n=1 Tax=Hahella sp. NBU794 TaxID=3422590 RepID=UPI003D6FB237
MVQTQSGIKRYEVGVLLYPTSMQSAVFGLKDLLSVAEEYRRQAASPHWPELQISFWRTGEDASQPGLASRPLHEALQTAPDVLIVPPCFDALAVDWRQPALTTGLQALHEQGTIMTSACAGSFALAGAGLLDGRKATTHWRLAKDFQAMFPLVELVEDELLVDQGDIVTAGGVSAWMDLGLRMIQRVTSASLTMNLGKFFLVDTGPRRQQYYQLFAPDFSHGDGAVRKLQLWLQEHMAEEVALEDMAAVARVGERTLQRRFRKALGMSPLQYVQQLRIQRARELLETSVTPVERIIWDVGYEDPSSFRKLFKLATGLTMTEYRARFQPA